MRCSAKKFAKCKLDSVGFVQSECCEITDPKRINRQKKALKLGEYVTEISNVTQAERALKSAQEDGELIPIAPAAIAKLLMDWSNIRTPNPEKLSNGNVAYGPYDIPKNA